MSDHPWIAWTASYLKSVSRVAADVFQSIRFSTKKPRLNQDRSRCCMSASTARSSGCSGRQRSKSPRMARIAAVPSGARLIRRMSSCRGGSTTSRIAASVSGFGVAWYASAACKTSSTSGDNSVASRVKKSSFSPSLRGSYASTTSPGNRRARCLPFFRQQVTAQTRNVRRSSVSKEDPSLIGNGVPDPCDGIRPHTAIVRIGDAIRRWIGAQRYAPEAPPKSLHRAFTFVLRPDRSTVKRVSETAAGRESSERCPTPEPLDPPPASSRYLAEPS